jgi:hypothetical protein
LEFYLAEVSPILTFIDGFVCRCAQGYTGTSERPRRATTERGKGFFDKYDNKPSTEAGVGSQ